VSRYFVEYLWLCSAYINTSRILFTKKSFFCFINTVNRDFHVSSKRRKISIRLLGITSEKTVLVLMLLRESNKD
jgi:hypothetical protein